MANLQYADDTALIRGNMEEVRILISKVEKSVPRNVYYSILGRQRLQWLTMSMTQITT